MITYEDFEKVDIRVGKILSVEDFPEARKPAYKLTIDFGSEIGTKRSSVQITKHYTKEDLVGKLVIGVVNFPPKQIGPFISETLTLGLPDGSGGVVLLSPSKEVCTAPIRLDTNSVMLSECWSAAPSIGFQTRLERDSPGRNECACAYRLHR